MARRKEPIYKTNKRRKSNKMKEITLELIESLSEMLSAKLLSKEYIKERLTNLASIASLDGEIKQLNRKVLPTYLLGQVGLTEPENHKPTEENEQN